MKLDLFVQKTSNISAENRLLKFAIVVMAVAMVMSGYIIKDAINKKMVILVPPGLDQKVEISGEHVDKTYLKFFARYISDLAFTYAPDNARSQFSEVLSYYDTGSYSEGKKTLYQTADSVETTGAISDFKAQSLNVDTGKNTITVHGTRRLFVKDIKIEEGPKTFIIGFKAVDGRVYITSILEENQAQEKLQEKERQKVAGAGAPQAGK